MIRLKSQKDIPFMIESGRRLARLITELREEIKPGVTTAKLDDLAREKIKALGDEPAFLNFRPKGSRLAYPAALCVSVNEEIVHGIPSTREIVDGDVVTIDLGLNHHGYFTDHAVTVALGQVQPEIKHLLTVTEEALYLGIKAMIPGNTIGDIGYAIGSHVKNHKLGLIQDLAGHGVGFSPHEEPLVPNDGHPGKGLKLTPGLVLAIEPMVSLGSDRIDLLDDGFTFVTKDDSISAHFEHTVLITETGPIILTKN